MAAVATEPRSRNTFVDVVAWPRISVRSAWHMWERNFMRFRRGIFQYVLPNFLEPILYLLAIGLGLGLYVGTQILGVEYVAFLAPGLAASSAMYGAVFEVTWNSYFKMKVERNYDSVIATPLGAEEVALGELLWATTRSGIYGTAFTIVLVVLGHAESWLVVFSPLALPLIGMAMGVIGMSFTILAKQIEYLTYFFNLFVIPLFLFSGIFFPVSDLPGWARTLAWFTPLHHGVEMNRALVLTGDAGTAALHAVWLVAFILLLLPIPMNLLRRFLRV